MLETLRKYPLLKLLLCFHGMIVAILVAFYYKQAHVVWYSVLHVPVGRAEDGTRLYQTLARGPSLLLPWHLLPQDVFWLALDILIFGTLTMWLTYLIVENELRHQVADREKAAADKLREAGEQSAAADRRMREAEGWEQRLKAREARAAAREFEAVNREADAQAHMDAKDVEVEKMSAALTRLKTDARDLRQEVRRLRGGLSGGPKKENNLGD